MSDFERKVNKESKLQIKYSVQDDPDFKKLRIVKSKRDNEKFNKFVNENLNGAKLMIVNSMGVKCCMVANNETDLYINRRCSFWDSVPSQVIIEEAGGSMLYNDGEEIVYKGLDTSHKKQIVCGSKDLVKFVLSKF